MAQQNHWILIAGEKPENLKELKELLPARLTNTQVISASDGVKALQKIQRQHFELVIASTMMARRSGTDLVQDLLQIPADNKPNHVFLVGDKQPDTLQGNPNAFVFIQTPFDAGIFIDSIRGFFPEASPETSKEAAKPKVDVNFINPFIDSTLNVLKITANTKAEKKRVFLRPVQEPVRGDISALISITSDKCVGSMAVTFEEKCFLAVASGMLGETFTTITTEIEDVAGELCNQIFGGAKKVLNEQGYKIQPALPAVIAGKNHTIRHTVQGTCIAVEFSSTSGTFFVEAVIKPIG
ncbi:chemotaxis protein CheX [Bdellovibrionota bacterium FG-2]